MAIPRDQQCIALPAAGERREVADGELVLFPGAFSPERSARLFQILLREIPWAQHLVTVYGRQMAAPRLSAWYGDPGAGYSYSGMALQPLAWTGALAAIRETVQRLAGTHFNGVLLNLYRDGRDSVGWHSDAEPELGRNPVIASVSLGAVRRFVLQHKKSRTQIALDLEAGSVLVMAGALQHHWRHQLPKTARPVGPRINLTFRHILRGDTRAVCGERDSSAGGSGEVQ